MSNSFVGKAAKAPGFGLQTVRDYERLGLLTIPERTGESMGRGLAMLILGALLAGAAAPAQAQIVAPAGRTLFNHGMMVRSVIRIDNFTEPVPGLRLRRITNPYAFIWGAHTNWSVSVVAPLVSFQSNSNSVPAQDFRTTSFGDGRIFVRYDAWVKNVAGGSTRLSPEIGVKVPSGGTFSTGSTDVIGGLIFSHVRAPNGFMHQRRIPWKTAV